MSRKDYIDYKTRIQSPYSKQDWEQSWSNDFDSMQKFVWERCHTIPLYKRIGLAAAFSLMLVGIIATVWLALKCLFM